MGRMTRLVLSLFSYMLIGYLTGLIIGFTLFDPNTDIYALLGFVLALVGLGLGLIPLFQRRVKTAFGILIGFYAGLILSIIIWGDTATDDLLEVVQRGGAGLILAIVFAILGGFILAQLNLNGLSIITLLLGGFLGGAVFVSLGVAPKSSMVGTAPFVIGSGVALALLMWRLQKAFEPASQETPA